MKLSVKSLTILFAASLVLGVIRADDPPNIPAGSWEQHAKGIALALILTSRTENGMQTTRLTAYAKNTSGNAEGLWNQGNAMFAKFFYVDDQGNQISLGDSDGLDDDANPMGISLSPGEVKVAGEAGLTAEEVVLIKKHTVICSVVVSDLSTKQKRAVNSSPKLLVPIP